MPARCRAIFLTAKAEADASGILLNRATTLLLEKIPSPSVESYAQTMRLGMLQMAQDGFVAVHEAGAESLHMSALEQLQADAQLPIRMYAMLSARDEALSQDWAQRGPHSDPSGFLDVRSVKAYYDGALGSYLSGSSLLDANNYGNYTVVQDLQNQNATNTGNLGFEGNLSFLNYTIDLDNTSGGGNNLPSNGSWLTTSQLCFTMNQTVFDDPNSCFEAVWARMDTTAEYATSFVEVAEWVMADSTEMANGMGVQYTLNDKIATAVTASVVFTRMGFYNLGARIPGVRNVLDNRLTNKLASLLDSYGHADFITDASKYKLDAAE